jgi:hypothetical protein
LFLFFRALRVAQCLLLRLADSARQDQLEQGVFKWQVRAKDKLPKQLPPPNSDFYELVETLPAGRPSGCETGARSWKPKSHPLSTSTGSRIPSYHIKTVRQEFRRPACANDASTDDGDPPYRFVQYHVVFSLPADLNLVA